MTILINNSIIIKRFILELEANQSVTKATEEDIRGLLSGFKEYVITKNMPECKNFIQNFVKEVIVYKTHVEVVFNVGFNFIKNNLRLENIGIISRNNIIIKKVTIQLLILFDIVDLLKFNAIP